MRFVKQFINGYFECVLWAELDNEENPLDDYYCIDDISEESRAQQIEECRDFIKSNLEDLFEYTKSHSWESAGQDFWLNRNRHGLGFWDRGLDDLGYERLSDASKVYSSRNVYVIDGKVYIE